MKTPFYHFFSGNMHDKCANIIIFRLLFNLDVIQAFEGNELKEKVILGVQSGIMEESVC